MHSATSTTQTGNEQSEPAFDAQEKEQQTRVLVNMLFARFKAIYTHKFSSAYSNSDEVKLAKREWAIAIKGYQEPLLAFAVERAKEAYAWPPTISEFLKLINTAYSAYRLPSPREAYLEACQCRENPLDYKWTHAAVYHAGAKTGWYALRSEEEIKTWPMFEKNYDEQVALAIKGEVLPIPKAPLIEYHQEDSIGSLITELMEKTDLPETEVAQLLYYLHKTKGTSIRTRYRQISQARLDEKYTGIVLPQ